MFKAGGRSIEGFVPILYQFCTNREKIYKDLRGEADCTGIMKHLKYRDLEGVTGFPKATFLQSRRLRAWTSKDKEIQGFRAF